MNAHARMPVIATEKPASVRIATPADIEQVYWLTYSLWADNYMGFSFSPKKMLQLVTSLCSGKKGVAGVIEGPDGKIIGSVGIAVSQPAYSDDWYLGECWNYVVSEYRHGTQYGQDLFRFAQWHREDMCARLGKNIPMEISVFSLNRLKTKTRWWGRYGRHVGSMFWIGGAP